MKMKMTLALLALVSSTAAFASTPPVAGFRLSTTDAVSLGLVSALMIAVLLFRAQVRKLARQQSAK
ncbi:hypothetical protein EPD60_00440 [Flaviaesturariibacter flavus]|uniref:CcmD family protein n=1 Tax=Flaviaesturariibacter flavus TaxID=2502780 RepID=A0A4R1BPS2_9BACT|nr:hypothetical protein [Flaviaesturariibacter flavus]TCJ19624.1 hypothetical protein EPD60_00440 [Flaviaesturariibacter flavus]